MGFKLSSVSYAPSSAAVESISRGEQVEPILEAVKTRATDPPNDVTPSSWRRLVVGKSDKPLFADAGSMGLETVIGLDERTRIVSTSTAPWKYVCALEIVSPFGAFIGTGWVVAPRTLITAGHCVFDKNQMGGWAREIQVSPGRDRDLRPFGTRKVVSFSTVDRWLENQDPDFDIAALHLGEDLFGPNEGFQVGAFPDDELKNFLVNVSGYPGTPGGGQEQWWAKNRVREVSARRIFYDVDTSGGQSGGPAFIFPDDKSPPIVIGIHAYGVGGTPATIPMQVNSAPRMIPEVVDQIQAWIEGGPQGNA